MTISDESEDEPAKLNALGPEKLEPRVPGMWKGKIRIGDDFDDPLPEEIMAAFRGERD